MNLIIDTDVGYDDLLAILYLMNCPDITIEAFTVVNGISTVTEGSNALLSLQEMLGIKSPGIPVYLGAEAGRQPNQLPADYRGEAKALNWALPTYLKAQKQSASNYLADQFRAGDTTVLAIGPLTNLAVALPIVATHLITLFVMGGAFKVSGDLLPTPPYPGDVEANFYVDPEAASTVMAYYKNIGLVPLDACDQVPITTDFVTSFGAIPVEDQQPNWTYANEILTKASSAFGSTYYAWDELAAMALISHQNVLSGLQESGVSVELIGPGNASPGKTTAITGNNVGIYYTASSKNFNDTFLAAFST